MTPSTAVRHIRPNWRFILILAVCIVVPVGFALTGYDPRPASSVIGFLAFIVLCLRFAENYSHTPTSTRIALVLIGSSLILGAIATAQLADRHTAYTFATYPLLGHRLACLMFVAHFPRVLALDTRNPWVVERT